ncbi:hypothetical protein pdam_00013613 [Pocillopora damicornis]|uniref:Uncharacterized protein n=2 Tax=Pocillopora TaxID=46730 RepID=A0A3M6U263_POCDA|nr:uncharacterized protein LOC113669804 [Pocillopora damicornis]XP_058958496.1 uncharacterized protein LOC131785592 [Pocillopora verrucosa]RMX47676.1 hypothetical protein pdam_00013613 [Pocillopora damicornis]CAH3150700.1 unnamed protein product [Pocillopora meandrina]
MNAVINNNCKMAERERKVSDNNSSSTCTNTSGDTASKFDRVVLLHFFIVFVSSFALGLLFLHSSLTFWRLQIYEESGFFDNTNLDASSRYIPKDDIVNVVTYNANSSFSLVR